MSRIVVLGIVTVVMFCVLGGITLLAHIYNLNNIKSKTVGDGQYGTARWATDQEIRKAYVTVPFNGGHLWYPKSGSSYHRHRQIRCWDTERTRSCRRRMRRS